jgi:hypothetical protein
MFKARNKFNQQEVTIYSVSRYLCNNYYETLFLIYIDIDNQWAWINAKNYEPIE